MIRLSSVSKGYGGDWLFQDVSLQIDPQDRIGLVGDNGTGKTTLLRLIAGYESPDAGSIERAGNISVGYLPQYGIEPGSGTVFSECLRAFDQLRQIEREIHQLRSQLASLEPSSPEYEKAASRLADLEEHFRIHDGFQMEATTERVLKGLGFTERDFHRPVRELSGGWQMRVALARLLLEKPQVLLLDEPTNHLDLEARNWLEEYLKSYPGAFVLVSHDRYFLDVTVKKIFEIWNRQVRVYTGNYSQYLEQKQQWLEQLEAAYRNQQKKVRQLEVFINRFRYKATKARQVQSRIKELERMPRIELPQQTETIHFKFPQPPASGRVVAELRGVTKAFGQKTVLRDISLTIERGERIALVGPNGAGKSTFLKLLAGVEAPTAGIVRLGHNVSVSYFAQDQYQALDPEQTLLGGLWALAPQETQARLRSLLGCFLFSGDDVFKKVGVLSGGERNRYALARLLLQPTNFLLLDEPTNHLDIKAQEVLLEALKQYTGTVVFVSHDRYLVNELATRIIEVSGQQVHDYPGNYEDYLSLKQKQLQAAATPDEVSTEQPIVKAKTQADNGSDGPRMQRRRVNPMRVRMLEQEIEQLENEVDMLEKQIAQKELELAHFESEQKTRSLLAEIEQLRQQLEERLKKWEELSQWLEAAKG